MGTFATVSGVLYYCRHNTSRVIVVVVVMVKGWRSTYQNGSDLIYLH